MLNAQLKRKLDALTMLANEIDDEAKQRHGDDGGLIFSATGKFAIVSRNTTLTSCDPDQPFVYMISRGVCNMRIEVQ